MEQLDLFGFPVEPVKPAKKKEPAVKARAANAQPRPPAPEAIFTSQPAPETVVSIAEAEIAAVPEPSNPEPAPVEVEVVLAEEIEEPVIFAGPSMPEPEQIVALADPEEPQSLTQPRKPVKTAAAPTPSVKTSGKRGRKSFREMDSEADLVDVPEDSILQQKLYYSISEVAGWFKVNTSLLRFWENEFDILQPRKTRKGDRLFRVEDIKNLQLIYFLLRQRKFSIDGAKKYLKNNKKEADTQAQIVQSLNRFRSFLLELKTNIAS